ncbi:transposase domain-containing protein [Haliangium ochraceum]|nr:transposase domain-containing protein [Haliangium ochraceum]
MLERTPADVNPFDCLVDVFDKIVDARPASRAGGMLPRAWLAAH